MRLRKNWDCVNSVHGAKASAILYSLVAKATANNLGIYEYLLSELAEHTDDTKRDFLKDLLP